MQERFISLLYPTEDSRLRHIEKKAVPNISGSVCYELGLEEIFDLKNGEEAYGE